MLKKILKYLICLIPWFLGGILFRFNKEFYSQLSLPSFVLPGYIISIIWSIIFILVALSIYNVSKENKILKNNDYLYILLTFYLSVELFPLMFFTLRSVLLGFIMSLIAFISLIFLIIETKEIKKSAIYYLIPVLLFNIYALITSFVVLITNL
ncbi:MAG: tryptophan-rich sensory protein [Bacilli bacterium]